MARTKKNATEAWLERWNPLHGLSIREAQGIFDAARGGDTQRLHWIYQEIESANPVLLVCVERRSSAIANFRWKVSEQAAKNGALSEEQKDAAETLINGIENFTDALEHLDLAFFRGFAHAQPVWEPDGTVREISLLDSWKFVRKDREWFYNPACTGFGPDMESTDGCRLMTVTRRRAVDYPALAVHIREAVGERDWGRFLERYALPKPAVTMPPGTTEAQRGDFVEAAERVENGQTSVWPSGTTLSDFAGNSRGTDPFSAFVEHQDKKIVLMATGGTLASLAEAGAGTLAGNAQADVWRSIVARDSAVIAQAVQRSLVLPFIQAKFPGQPCAVNFDFDFDEPPTAKEVFEIAVAANNAGWKIAKEQLEEQSGYTLEEDATQNPMDHFANGLQKPPAFANKRVDGQGAEAHGGDVLSAFAQDTRPAADAIRELLEDPTPEKAKALLDRLPELLPEDPALAAVIAEEMAKEFGSVASGSPDALANKTDANGNEHGEDNGQFVSKGGGASATDSDEEKKKKEEAKQKAKREANHAKGKAAWEKAVTEQVDVPNAMERDSIGGIDFVIGFPGTAAKGYHDGYGISHIFAAGHGSQAAMIPGVIAYGDIYEDQANGKYYIVKKRNLVVLSKRTNGNNLLITGYKKDDPKAIAKIRKENTLVEKGE